MRRDRYYTLMAALPALEPITAEERPPCSRVRLEKLLQMLEPEDAEQLETLEGIMFFDRLSFDLTDREIVEGAETALATIRSPLLREVAENRLWTRTVVAALRRRHAGAPAPEKGEKWGFGPWTYTIAKNWNRRDFGLGGVLPEIEEFAGLVEREDAVELEKRLLLLVWRYLSRTAEGHYFDFEAVALYVLRWDLLRRWTTQDPAAARERFDGLMEASWGKYASALQV
jgi:hypothetical protein